MNGLGRKENLEHIRMSVLKSTLDQMVEKAESEGKFNPVSGGAVTLYTGLFSADDDKTLNFAKGYFMARGWLATAGVVPFSYAPFIGEKMVETDAVVFYLSKPIENSRVLKLQYKMAN